MLKHLGLVSYLFLFVKVNDFLRVIAYAITLRISSLRKSDDISIVYYLRSIGLRINNSNIGLAYAILYLILYCEELKMFNQNIIKVKPLSSQSDLDRKNLLDLAKAAVSGDTKELNLKAKAMDLNSFQMDAVKEIARRYSK